MHGSHLKELPVLHRSGDNFFAKAAVFWSACPVRLPIFFLALFFVLPMARGQDQENKLVDRLLRPKTELKNSAQDKKFVADRRSINKKASVRDFYVRKRSNSKEFGGTRDFSSWEFNAGGYRGGQRKANSTSRSVMANAKRKYSTEKTVELRSAVDSNRKVADRDFAGQRPFLGKGKSQKALSQHDTPLTIDQIRELLNKK